MYSTHPFSCVCRRVCNFTPGTLIITCCTYLVETNPSHKMNRMSTSQYLPVLLKKERTWTLHTGNIDKWHLNNINSSRKNAADQPLNSTLLCSFTAVQGVLQSFLCISVNMGVRKNIVWFQIQTLGFHLL